MSNRRAASWILLFCVLAFVGAGGFELLTGKSRTKPPKAGSSVSARVVRVIDGDTVEVQLDSGEEARVRYIGVDTPETVKPGVAPQCFGKAASAYNKRLVGERRVRLRIGREATDRYGRLLAYVYLRPGGRFVNEELVRRGYARTLSIAPNTRFAARFAAAERRARMRDRGLWSACAR